MLDVLGDRLMFRLSYRQFADHGSLLVEPHGRRCAEHRRPLVRGPLPEGGPAGDLPAGDVCADDNVWRWMGSVAMDNDGNIGLGYSASGPSALASVRYTGRPQAIRSGR